MRLFLRRCRGAIGFGVTWGLVWAAIFFTLGIVAGFIDPDSIDPGEEPIRIARIGGFLGFVSGAAFAVLLSLGDGRKTIRNLSLIRVAIWGAVGSALFPLLTPANNSMLLLICPIGAALAAGSVAIAKRAELRASAEPPRLSAE
jgi:hypothetical protein